MREDGGQEGFIQRTIDYVFGYDFFISYSHGDGKVYPQQLKRRLDQAGFKVFLDQTEYVAGLDLRRETKRHVEKSRQVVVVGRPAALESRWVKREVDVALAVNKTPVIISVNGAVETAPPTAPVAAIALAKHWLRLHETIEDADGVPSDNTVNELIRGFRYTRQQTKRVRIFAAASAVLAMIAGLAIWQAIEAVVARDRARANEIIASENAKEAKRQKDFAEANERQAQSERDRALAAQSRFLGGLADQHRNLGDSVTAILLALEGLPETAGQRPYVPETERALFAAFAAQREKQLLAGHEGGVLSVAMSPDGKRIATASEDKTARMWDAETGALIEIMKGHTDKVKGALFNRKGDRLITFAGDTSRTPSDGTVRLWDGLTGKAVAALPQGGTVLTALFSPDDERILTAGTEGAKLWEARSGQLVAQLTVDTWLYNVFFSNEGGRLLTKSDGKRSRLWNARTGELLFELAGEPLSLLPDGKRAVTSVEDRVLLWDATTGKRLVPLLRVGRFQRRASARMVRAWSLALGTGNPLSGSFLRDASWRQ